MNPEKRRSKRYLPGRWKSRVRSALRVQARYRARPESISGMTGCRMWGEEG